MPHDKASGVLFDVDGTLVDTTYLHTVSWWEALRQADRPVPLAPRHPPRGKGPPRPPGPPGGKAPGGDPGRYCG